MDEVKKYSVIISPKVDKKMEKLDAPVRHRITKWIRENLVDCENPRIHGKALTANLKEYWRYRVGDYRIVAEIKDDEVVILIVKIDKRENVYEQNLR